MSDWADEIAAQLVTLHDAEECGQWMIANRPAVAAALRKERESTVERCAVVVDEWAASLQKAADDYRGTRWSHKRDLASHVRDAARRVRALNIPKGD